MQYKISYKNPLSRLIDISLTIEKINQDLLILQCPRWRPGRYELADYAQNIQKLSAEDEKGKAVAVKKTTAHEWQIETKGCSKITVYYNYFAHEMNAGSSWLDEEQVYINFINLALFEKSRTHDTCSVELDIPKDMIVATGLEETSPFQFKAKNYFNLVDSPLIAAKKLFHKSFEVDNCLFHLWIHGECSPSWSKVLSDFKSFTETQIKLFGEFPCEEYHYLIQILPYKHYHGVEHSNSTVITLGPGEDFNESNFYSNLLGISSHELFHTWNVTRIRPQELVPYDFSQENYYETGFITEGLTTYYGDLMLYRSGVFNKSAYFNELNTLFNRHFNNYGRHVKSLAESSTDLWLDGYKKGIPHRKVSIYIKGAISAFILDLEVRKASGNNASLDDVMRKLWADYRNNAPLTIERFIQHVDDLCKNVSKSFIKDCIFSTIPLEKRLKKALKHIGCTLKITPSRDYLAAYFGILLAKRNDKYFVNQVSPNTINSSRISVGDEIISIESKSVDEFKKASNTKANYKVSIIRHTKALDVEISRDDDSQYHSYEIIQETENRNFDLWAN